MENQITYQVVVNGQANDNENVFTSLKEASKFAAQTASESAEGTRIEVIKHLYRQETLRTYVVEPKVSKGLTKVLQSA
jgi:hypothetical protein